MNPDWTLATWNVNSIRVRIEHVQRVLVEWRPDVLCLQETKVTDDVFPYEPFEALGYKAAVLGQKTYNGVAIISRHPIEDVKPGFDGSDGEEEKRLLAATVGGVRVINAYVPNGNKVGSDKFAYKLDFLARLRDYLARDFTTATPLALVGDFNVAPTPDDVYDHDALDGSVCYHPDERAALERLRDWGLVDQFRAFNSSAGVFSWWDYREGAFARDAGLRIDHIWVTPALAARATACLIERSERGQDKASDHVPVVAAYQPGAG